MSKRVIAVAVAILVVIVVGMVLTMKRSLKAGAAARDPASSIQKPAPPARK